MFNKRKFRTIIMCTITGFALAGCSPEKVPLQTEATQTQPTAEEKEVQISIDQGTGNGSQGSGSQGGQGSGAQEAQGNDGQGTQGNGSQGTQGTDSQGAQSPSPGTGGGDGYPRGSLIPEQTFDVTLRPLGQVTFASYEPDTSADPLADVVFLIEKGGRILSQLPGTTADNVGSGRFRQVEAVSFTDYNHDNCDDIILILSYDPGSGSQAATPYSVIRYYTGTAAGTFTYEAGMSENATSALADITIQTAKNFISGGRTDEPGQNSQDAAANLQPWQKAYIQYLSEASTAEYQRGYTLIFMSNDGIPQIAEVGTDEATGCRIVHYADGDVHVTQLNRLYFSYIPHENLLCNSEGHMDYYYDLVYRLNGPEMELVAAGYYGAEDNSRIQLDANGSPIYQYEWNGVKVSPEEYGSELGKVYDSARAVSYDYDDLYSVEEMIQVIGQY